MKKYFLFTLLLAATSLFAKDLMVPVAIFDTVNFATGDYTVREKNSTLKWDLVKVASRKQDTVNTATRKQAAWLSVSNAGRAKMSTKNWEGGIKSVEFKFARFGKENTNGRSLQLKVMVGTDEFLTDSYEKSSLLSGNVGAIVAPATTTGHIDFEHAFNNKSADAQLIIENNSAYTETLTASGICRILVADLAIAPYIYYTAKEATLDLRLGSNKYTNTGFIDNTDDGAITYSLEDNDEEATIDAATGEVTALKAGEVTVKATWSGLTTTYKLTILAKEPSTASFDKENIRIKIGEDVPTNTLTTNSTGKVSYVSSTPAVAGVDPATGVVTIAGVGTTTITANVAENDDYLPTSASYILRVMAESWKIETFDKISYMCIVCPTPSSSCSNVPVTDKMDNGVSWTYWLGGGNEAQFSSNRAMYLRARLDSESAYDYGYVRSSKINGGLSRLAFDWKQGGKETVTYNVAVVVNGDTLGWIRDAGQSSGDYTATHRFEVTDKTISGDIVIEIINYTKPSATSGNTGRIVINDLEWEGYCDADFGMLVDGTKYISGARDWSKTDHMEYKIVADLDKDQVVEFQNYCTKEKLATITQEEGSYWFTNNSGVLSAPAKGTYTVYLKMYGIDNNSLWTEFVADSSTGIEGVQNTEYRVQKTIENGQLIIIREGKKYNAQGAKMR